MYEKTLKGFRNRGRKFDALYHFKFNLTGKSFLLITTPSKTSLLQKLSSKINILKPLASN